MRVFAESEVFREAKGLGAGGLSMEEVDDRTSKIIQIVKGQSEKQSSSGEERE